MMDGVPCAQGAWPQVKRLDRTCRAGGASIVIIVQIVSISTRHGTTFLIRFDQRADGMMYQGKRRHHFIGE